MCYAREMPKANMPVLDCTASTAEECFLRARKVRTTRRKRYQRIIGAAATMGLSLAKGELKALF